MARPERLEEILSLVRNIMGRNIDSCPKTVNSQGYIIINGANQIVQKLLSTDLVNTNVDVGS